ncbi:uncharacterized protein LOC118427037 [Branchiostoma floridae]|uniref:Uncharacterized protein LOC118427037 n=3 Tax=Branchiostoma floridae TaxID=7739 RepID=A0A9J7M1E4_BRAFL|nr:uncharacterized protein LOC118427037 [Branchiostoma floridae]
MLTTTFTSSPGIAAVQPIGFAPGCGGVVSTVQCAVAPFALATVSDTFQNLQGTLGALTVGPAGATVVSAATRTTVIVTVELTLPYTVDLQDTSSQAYTNLSVTIENAVLQVFAANPADIQSVSITSVAPGATATSTSVTVSVVTLGANVDVTTQIIVNTTAAGVQLGNLPVVSSTVGDTTPPCRAVADIVFLVDGTGSVGLENFERMKTFIRQLFAYLDIGENAVRVSIVQYAAQARTEFFLDQYYDLQEAQDAVDGIDYMGGYTLTGKAIDFATNLHFDLRKGARADVTKIAVVITDGISYDDVNRPARRMRQAGIVTIAVGVGNNLDRDQLLAIAGDPRTLLSLDDFDRLQDLTTSLPTMICDVGTSQQIVVSICITTTYGTDLLNANSSDSTALFQQVVQGLTTTFTSSPGIAAVQPIGFAPGCGGVVSTVQCAVAPFALETVSNTFQTLQVNLGDLTIVPAETTVVSAASRATVIVTVELTLDYTVDLQDTSSQAYIDLSVTIENAVLQVFAANPADIQSVSITSVAPGASATTTSVTVSVVTLGANVDVTTQIIVNTTAAGVQLGNLPVVSSTVGDTTPPCSAVADIVFIVDGTGSVGLENFERMKTFIGQLFAYLDIGENAVRVSIVQYAAQARTEFFLDQYYDLQEAQDAVDGIEYMGGYTLTGKAIDFATNLHFDLRKGARADVTKIAVVITDGRSYDDVNRPARRMRQAGIVTIAVGVGNNLDRDQLTAIAGDPKTLLSLDGFDRLQDLTTSLPTMLCDVGTSQQIVVSICITTIYDTNLLNANSSDSTALFQQVVQGLTTTFASSPGIAAVQPIGFAPGCGGVVSTVQCAVAPFALETVSNTFQTLQVNLGDLTIVPAETTVVSAASRTTVIVTVELTLDYTVDLQDTSSQAYIDLSVTIENAVLQVFAANPADIQSVSITSVAPGASATTTSVTVSVVTLGANVDVTTQIIVNTTAAGVQLGNLPVVSSTVGDTTPPCSAVADIVFIVDGTGSVGLENFERMKTFIRQLFAYLDIGENAVRVSIVQYAAQARTEFFLDQYYDLQEAQDAVDGIEYMGGYTLTGKAIDFATNLHFDLRKGARADVTKIAVVITDGRSYDDVNRPARRMRQAGIVTIAVGVGNNLDRDQLTAIAGDPKTLLSLDGFDRLQDLTTSLPTMLCDVGTSQQIVVSICITTIYDTNLLNANSSDSTALFQQVVQGLTTTFASSPGIAAVQPIGFAPGCGGVVSTVQCAVAPFALETVSNTFQTLQVNLGDLTIVPAETTVVSAASRTTVIVTVELTLDYTVDLQDTSSQAYIDLSVTIENAVLQVFAANPADIQSVSITSVAPGLSATSTSVTIGVVAVGDNTAATTSQIVNITAPGVLLGNLPVISTDIGDTPPPCPAAMDLVFVLDGTGSVGEENFESMKTIVQKIVADFSISPSQTRVGIIQYANTQRMEISLDAYSDVDSLQQAIADIEYMGGGTLTGQALDYTRKFGFSPNNGARPDVVQVAIVITDGVSNDEVSNPAQRMRKAQIVTYAVGIGSNLDNDQLLSIAGTSENVIVVSDFNRLTDLATTLPQQVCEVGKGAQLFISLSITSVTFTNDLLNADSSAYVTLVQQVNVGVTQTLGNVAGLNIIQVINFVPATSGVVVYCQGIAGLWASDSVTQSIASLPASFGPLTIDPATIEVAPTDTVGLYVSMEVQESFNGELMDQSSVTFQTLSTSLQVSTFNEFQEALSVSIVQFSAGSIATTTYVVLLIMVKTSVQTTFIQNFDAAIQSGSYGTLTVVSGSIATTEPTCPNQLDIIFVLDGSGSIGTDNFERIKTFVSKAVTRFNIGPTQTQIGVIQYSNQPQSEILLNDHQDAASLQQAISSINYLQGGTNTGKALRYLANNAFSGKNGARAGVSKVAIVVTDGRSSDDVVRPALNAGKEGIVLYAVGIGGSVDYQELRDIASSDDKVVNVTDFSGLQSVGNTLPDQVCQTGVEVFVQIPITGQTFNAELLNPLSVEYSTFSAVIAGWATRTLQGVSGFQSYQIVAIRPSTNGVTIVLRLVTAVFAQSMVTSTIQTDLQSGSLGSFTVNAAGIQVATEGFSTIHATIAYIGTFTAPLLDPTSTVFISLVQQMEVALFNIFVSVQGLYAIEVLQFNPLPNLIIAHAQFVIQPSALEEMQTTFATAVSGGLLDTLPVDPLRTTIEEFDAGCFTPLDIAILLDGSDGVSSDDFEAEKSFAKLFLNEFDIGQDNSRVTVFQYGTEPRQEFALDTYETDQDVQDAIADTEYMGGDRNLGQAIRYMATYGFSGRNGARRSIPSVAIIITGGESLDEVASAASKARRSGLILYAIGVGNATVPAELAAIATTANTSYAAASFAALKDLRGALADEICTIGTVQIASMDISEDVTDLGDSAEYQALKAKIEQDVAEVIGPAGADQVNVLGLRVLP